MKDLNLLLADESSLRAALETTITTRQGHTKVTEEVIRDLQIKQADLLKIVSSPAGTKLRKTFEEFWQRMHAHSINTLGFAASHASLTYGAVRFFGRVPDVIKG